MSLANSGMPRLWSALHSPMISSPFPLIRPGRQALHSACTTDSSHGPWVEGGADLAVVDGGAVEGAEPLGPDALPALVSTHPSCGALGRRAGRLPTPLEGVDGEGEDLLPGLLREVASQPQLVLRLAPLVRHVLAWGGEDQS